MSSRFVRSPKSATGEGGGGGAVGRQRLMTQSQQQDQRVSRQLQQRRARRQTRRLNAMPFRIEIRGVIPAFIVATGGRTNFSTSEIISLTSRGIPYNVRSCCYATYTYTGGTPSLQMLKSIGEINLVNSRMRGTRRELITGLNGMDRDNFSQIRAQRAFSQSGQRLVEFITNYVFRDLPNRGNGRNLRSDITGIVLTENCYPSASYPLYSIFEKGGQRFPSIFANVHIELAFETLDAMLEFIYNHHLQYLTTLDGTDPNSVIRITMIERDNAGNPIQGREPRVLFDSPFFSLDMVPLIIQRANR